MSTGNRLNKEFMQIKKPRSHSPKIYDNTEEDLVLISPKVLDNVLRDLEEYQRPRNAISNNILLALALLVPIFTSTFRDFSFISGAVIRGAFIVGFLGALVLLGLNLYRMYRADRYGRKELINSLLFKQKENNK